MTDSVASAELQEQLADLLRRTRAMAKMLSSQQRQIEGMCTVLELLLAEPPLLTSRRDLVEKVVAASRGSPAASGVPPQSGLN